MIHKAFTIYDTKTEAYLRPFFCIRTPEAIRTFTDAVNDTNSPFYKHSEDFFLYEIGTWDDNLAELTRCAPINLGCAALLIKESDHS